VRLAVLLLVLAASGGDAARAYREGRFADAQALFAAAAAEAGDAATPSLLHNLALAALRAGDAAAAEAAAERLVARGGPAFAPFRDFVRGNAAFARCEKAAALASQVEAEPFAFDAAIALAKTAGSLWRAAASARGDWPEARRNAERALLLVADLEAKKKEAEEKRRKSTPDAPPPPPPPEKPPEAEPETEPADAAPALALLSDAEVRKLLDRLDAKEREKLALRRAERRARSGGAEKDW